MNAYFVWKPIGMSKDAFDVAINFGVFKVMCVSREFNSKCLMFGIFYVWWTLILCEFLSCLKMNFFKVQGWKLNFMQSLGTKTII